jgi:hypothetical protein
MPYGTDEATPTPTGGYGQDKPAGYDDLMKSSIQSTVAGMTGAEKENLRGAYKAPFATPQTEATKHSFSQKLQDTFDKQQEAQFLEYQTANSNVPAQVMTKARQLWIAKPQYDLDYIVKNLDKVTQEVAADRLPGEMIASQHPVLSKYLQDPSTLPQTLQDSASLTGIAAATGGMVDTLKPDGTVEKRWSFAPWMLTAKDALVNNTQAMYANLGVAAFKMDEAVNKTLRDIGFPEALLSKPGTAEEGRKEWEAKLDYYTKRSTSAKDYRGYFDWNNAAFSAKVARTAGYAVEKVAENADLLIGAALAGRAGQGAAVGQGALNAMKGHAAGVLAFNTTYSTIKLFPEALEKTDSIAGAMALTVAGAPVLGKLMSWSPASAAVGGRPDFILRMGTARAASEAMAGRDFPYFMRATVAKMGWDAATGQIAFGMQRAADAMVGQLALAMGGKDADVREVGKAFWQGLTDPAGLPLSVFGTIHTLFADRGRIIRAKEMADRILQLHNSLIDSKTADMDPQLHEQQVHDVANQPGHEPIYYLPLEKFNEHVTKEGYNPREVAAEIHGDGGAAYDKAVSEGAEHLAIPVEKLRAVFMSKHIGDFALNEGSLDTEVISRAAAAKITEEFQMSLEAAFTEDPAKMGPEAKAVRDLILVHTNNDMEKAKEIYANIKALAARHGQLSLREIYDATAVLFGDSARRTRTDVENDSLVYRHNEQPLAFHVGLGDALYPHEVNSDYYVGNNLTVEPKEGEAREQATERARGTGGSTDLYFAALRDAQKAGKGWSSDRVRLKPTQAMYKRLMEKAGIPFKLVEHEQLFDPKQFEGTDIYNNRYMITPEELAKVDLDAAQAKLAGKEVEKGGATKLLTPVDQAIRGLFKKIGLYKMEGLDEKSQAKIDAADQDSWRAVRKRIDEAIKRDPKLIKDNPQWLTSIIMDSVHSPEVAKAVMARVRELGAQLDPIRQYRSTMSPEMWERMAERMVNDRTLRSLSPDIFARAARAAGEKAEKALTEGNRAKAYDATEAQLLNHYLYRAARVLEGDLGAMHDTLAERASSDAWRATLGKADPAYRGIHDAILGAIGIGEKPENAHEFMGKFVEAVTKNGQGQNLAMDNTADGGWKRETVENILAGKRQWRDLKPDEAKEVFKAIKNIQHIAREQKAKMKALRDGETEQMIEASADYMSQGGVIPPNDIMQEKGQEGPELSERSILAQMWKDAFNEGARLILKRMGPDVQAKVDGGFMDARAKALDLLNKLYFPWKETQKIWEEDPNFHKVIPGLENELRLTDANGIPLNGGLSKKYLVQAMKWMGSESGRKKLVAAFNVPVDKVLKLAAEHLTPKELEAIQAEHDFFDEHLLPLKQEAWERRTGLPLAEVKSMPYEVTWKETDPVTGEEKVTFKMKMKGGYYPIHWDGRAGVEKTAHEVEMDPSRQGNPKVGDGSFRERTDYVGVPDLDWNNVPHHLMRDIHNIAFGDFVQEANRVLLDPRMLANIRRYMGADYASWPRHWLERVASETGGSVSGHLAEISDAARLSRSNFVTGILGMSLPTLMAHMTHPLAVAVMRDGVSMSVTHAAPSMMKVMESAANALATGVDPIHDMVMAKSKYVPLYLDELPSQMGRWFKGTFGTNVGEGLQLSDPKTLLNSGKWLNSLDRFQDKAQMVGFWHLREMSKLASDMIWHAKYTYEMGKHGVEADAIDAADEQVRASMPNFNVMEAPSILAEKKGAIVSSLLIFHTFFAKYREMFNEGKHEMVGMPFKLMMEGEVSKPEFMWSAARFAGRAAAMLTVGIVGGEFLKGSGKREDEDWTTWAIRRELAAPFKLFPYASDLVEHGLDTSVRGYGKASEVTINNPYFGPIVRSANAIQGLLDHRKPDEEKVFDMITAALMLTGAPAVAPTRAGRYLYRWAAGEESPRGPLDVAAHLTYPKRYDRSARYSETDPLTLIQDMGDIR